MILARIRGSLANATELCVIALNLLFRVSREKNVNQQTLLLNNEHEFVEKVVHKETVESRKQSVVKKKMTKN